MEMCHGKLIPSMARGLLRFLFPPSKKEEVEEKSEGHLHSNNAKPLKDGKGFLYLILVQETEEDLNL